MNGSAENTHSNATPALFTVAQFAERHPAWTQPSLRNLIHKATSRHSSLGVVEGNGLAECGAILRVGRKVLISEPRFFAWVEDKAAEPRGSK